MKNRFTIDGSRELEDPLEQICGDVSRRVSSLIPENEIEAIVLGGGYGRGEGGVLRLEDHDKPYNDLEFYIFVNGSRLRDERRYGGALHELGRELSVGAGIQVEFKIDSLKRWRRGPVSMFSYDLVSGHQVVYGDEAVFERCRHHLDATAIPLSEATRLMFNRCSGLLLTREILERGELTGDDADFIGRNFAKMQLALGDALLTVLGLYHWSARERHRLLMALSEEEVCAWLPEIQTHHWAGLKFKLHPRRVPKTADEFASEFRSLAGLTMRLWLWLEGRRLKKSFHSPSEYALSDMDKCPESSTWRNYLLSLRTFGAKAALAPMSWRYPRERLFNALALLLWDANAPVQPRLLRRLQHALQTDALDWVGLVEVFKRVWSYYG